MFDRQHVATAVKSVRETTVLGLFAKRDPSALGECMRAAREDNVEGTNTNP